MASRRAGFIWEISLVPYRVIFHICRSTVLESFLQKGLQFSIDWGILLQVEVIFNLQLWSILFFWYWDRAIRTNVAYIVWLTFFEEVRKYETIDSYHTSWLLLWEFNLRSSSRLHPSWCTSLGFVYVCLNFIIEQTF